MTTVDAFPSAHLDPGIDTDRRYTTRETMDLCMRLAGVDAWDLDVAADAESHWAPIWYDAQNDGLNQPWSGRVWCNPPFSDLAPWVKRAWCEFLRPDNRPETIAMLVPATRTEQPWWQNWVEPYRDRAESPYAHPILYDESLDADARLTTRFLPGRIKFGHPGNREAHGVGSPPFGCVLLVWRRT